MWDLVQQKFCFYTYNCFLLTTAFWIYTSLSSKGKISYASMWTSRVLEKQQKNNIVTMKFDYQWWEDEDTD